MGVEGSNPFSRSLMIRFRSAAFARALHLRDGGLSHSGQMPLEDKRVMSTGDSETDVSAAVEEGP